MELHMRILSCPECGADRMTAIKIITIQMEYARTIYCECGLTDDGIAGTILTTGEETWHEYLNFDEGKLCVEIREMVRRELKHQPAEVFCEQCLDESGENGFSNSSVQKRQVRKDEQVVHRCEVCAWREKQAPTTVTQQLEEFGAEESEDGSS
jgi:hypothetical protein